VTNVDGYYQLIIHLFDLNMKLRFILAAKWGMSNWGNWGQIPIVSWGRIFLVFRSKNGPQAVRL